MHEIVNEALSSYLTPKQIGLISNVQIEGEDQQRIVVAFRYLTMEDIASVVTAFVRLTAHSDTRTIAVKISGTSTFFSLDAAEFM